MSKTKDEVIDDMNKRTTIEHSVTPTVSEFRERVLALESENRELRRVVEAAKRARTKGVNVLPCCAPASLTGWWKNE